MLNFSGPSAEQLFAAAFQNHTSGNLAEAERLYRQVLSLAPGHAETWHLLGALQGQAGRPEAGIDLIVRAIALNPRNPIYHSNLGELLRATTQHERAEAELRTALAMDPSFADAYTNLGAVLMQTGREAQVVPLMEECIGRVPQHASAHRMLGDALTKLRQAPRALAAYERAVAINPALADAWFNMAVIHADAGRNQQAEAAYRRVLALSPGDFDARAAIAEVLQRMNRTGEALAEIAAALQLRPDDAEAWSRQANILRSADRVDEALRSYQRALELKPDDGIVMANMAFALRDQARLEEAIALLRRALEREPDLVAVRSALIFSMHLLPAMTMPEIQREQQAWNLRHSAPLAAQRLPHANDRTPDRPLRVGYVSADLRSHPVGRFMLPLLRNHDRSRVVPFCYYSSRAGDAVTAEIQKAAETGGGGWRSIVTQADEAAEAAIRADGIDILVDLNNHTIDNRMPLFARKPAPVLISYLAFCAGTGVDTFDWRLTDSVIDPPGEGDDAPFEKPLRLADTYWCYAAHPSSMEVSPLPALENGHVTFGSFNYFSKVTDGVLALWAKLLQRMPAARMMLHVPLGELQAHVRSFMASQGIAPERLHLVGRLFERLYFQNYCRVDVALDPFPWAGGTTTCDALWMGVPVITLGGGTGRRTLSRGGASILTHLGRREWIAASDEEYLRKAEALAGDLPRLAEIRAGLRRQMQGSVLMDAPRFARNVEEAYRKAWLAWCR